MVILKDVEHILRLCIIIRSISCVFLTSGEFMENIQHRSVIEPDNDHHQIELFQLYNFRHK